MCVVCVCGVCVVCVYVWVPVQIHACVCENASKWRWVLLLHNRILAVSVTCPHLHTRHCSSLNTRMMLTLVNPA